MNKNIHQVLTTLALPFLCLASTHSFALTPFEKLGEKLYFDTNLSEPNGQACASCHLPSAGLADPDQNIPVSEGIIPDLFGDRNSPTASYAMYSPVLHYDEDDNLWFGGQFLDGRATGWLTGDPLADQALGPFLNPVEMANPSKQTVVRDAKRSNYKSLFKAQCGDVRLSSSDQVDEAYECIARAIGEFERTQLFAPFTSKYDAYLKACIDRGDSSYMELDRCAKGMGRNARRAAKKTLSKNEWAGLKLFMRDNNNDGQLTKGEGAGCIACHTADWSSADDYWLKVQTASWAPEGMIPPLFTDFSYDNIGIPKSEHALLINNPIDFGLGAQENITNDEENGKFKVSTLRNIAETAPYGHNGFFTTLRRITHFYNTRDTKPWPEAEVPHTMNNSELGSLGLRARQEQKIVAFMKTLSDGYFGEHDDEDD